MTLGPKFYTKLVSSITRRRRQVRRNEVHFQYTFSCALQDLIVPRLQTLQNDLFLILFFERYDIGTKIRYETCFVYNSTQKASPEELQVRIFTNLNFVKIRTCSSSVDSEFNIQTLLLPKICMLPWIRSLSHTSPQKPPCGNI